MSTKNFTCNKFITRGKTNLIFKQSIRIYIYIQSQDLQGIFSFVYQFLSTTFYIKYNINLHLLSTFIFITVKKPYHNLIIEIYKNYYSFFAFSSILLLIDFNVPKYSFSTRLIIFTWYFLYSTFRFSYFWTVKNSLTIESSTNSVTVV